MKKRIILTAIIVLFLMMIPLIAGAISEIGERYQIGDKLYAQRKGETLYITGSGPMWDGYEARYHDSYYDQNHKNYIQWYLWDDEVRFIDFSDRVTSIGNYAFYHFGDLERVVIPPSVKEIGKYAFYECESLGTIIISNGVKKIGEFAFFNHYLSSNSYYQTTVYIPASVTQIGRMAFWGPKLIFEGPQDLWIDYVNLDHKFSEYKDKYTYNFPFPTVPVSEALDGTWYASSILDTRHGEFISIDNFPDFASTYFTFSNDGVVRTNGATGEWSITNNKIIIDGEASGLKLLSSGDLELSLDDNYELILHKYINGFHLDDDGIYRYYEADNVVQGTIITEYNGNRILVVDGTFCADAQGLISVNNEWFLFCNGVVQKEYNGLYYDATYGWWLIQNGAIDWNYSGLYCDVNKGWWLIQGGQICWDYNGLYYDADVGWWLVNGGTIAWDYTGLWCDANYGWWLINNGTIAKDYNGLWSDPNFGWWLVKDGTIAFDYTGLWNDPNCGWWLIAGGQIAWDYTGLWNDPVVGWWLIGNGTICWDYTGLWNDPIYGWWLIGGGHLTEDYNGLWNDPNVGWWLIKNGTIDWGYTGPVEEFGATWNIVNGQLVF